MAQAKYSARASGIIAVLADKPVAYHPALAKQVGVKEAIFLCQLLYWDGRGARSDGWIWKKQKDMEEDTGLSRTEQETVRKHLIAQGVIEEKLLSVPATMHFRIKFENLAEILDKAYPSLQEPCNPVCGNPANLSAETPQSIPENTSENTSETTTENKTLCPERHNVSASAEHGESSPPNEEPVPLPSLEPVPETLNVAAPRRRIDAGNGELYPTSPGSHLLLDKFNAEQRAVGHRGTTKFQAVQDKRDFEWAESVLGDELEGAIVAALRGRGATMKLANVVSYVVTVAKGKSAKPSLPPLLFQKVAEAIRYDPEAQEHIPRISRLTETCQQRGYTPEEVRKAGRLWWEMWPGNTGTGPKDAEFLQKIVIVRKERL